MSLDGAILRFRAVVSPVSPAHGTGRQKNTFEIKVVSPVSPVSPLPDQTHSENDQALTHEITRAAHRFKLSPAALWSFLSADDIEALRTGTPEIFKALWAFAESRSLTGDTMPGGHDLPFPGAARPSVGLPLVRCGDCGHFQPDAIGDGTGIGRCRRDIQPNGGLMYPKIERACRGFEGYGTPSQGRA